MDELEFSRKFDEDLTGVFEYKGFNLRANVDAMTIMEAIAYMDEFEKVESAVKKNPENPVLKKKYERAALKIYEAICLIYDDEERKKIRQTKPTTADLGELVSKAIHLFNKREKEESGRKN